ncbi:hypothetical protein [Microbacterium hydrothermale]|uniref:hypothetical protein n=1 Tax=Microbacterium hydrothermale TaxID=857427 RepID=UPI0010A80300|nr:hypothetical protein [Microbacterium hydrothermale]
MSKWKMKTVLAASAAALLVGVSAPAANAVEITAAGDAQFAENQNLDAQQVRERTQLLNARYTEVGVELAPADAEFVTLYASKAPVEGAISTMAVHGGDFSANGSGAGGTGAISGSMYLDNAEFSVDNGYNGQLNATGSTNVEEITTCFNVRAYGTVGQSGVGLVYSDDPCQTNSGSTSSMGVDKRYSAFVVYSTITANATFRTASGTFQVSS